MDNKWSMFKNYMHNELGITKEDIRGWIQDAVKLESEKLAHQTFSSFSVEKTVHKIMMDDSYFGSGNLKREIKEEVAKQLMNKMELTLKN